MMVEKAYTKEEEPNIVKALRHYFEGFIKGEHGITLNYVASFAGTKVYKIVNYIADHAKDGLGQPGSKKEAERYLKVLEKLV